MGGENKIIKCFFKNAGQGAPLIASQIESAKANLNKWESALSEYNRLKKETEENSKPVEVKLMEARSNREQIIREYNIARQILQEEQEKLRIFLLLQFLLTFKYGSIMRKQR